MSLYDIVVSRRTVRQFQQKPVNEKILRKMVNAGRLAPSAANCQPLEFIVVTNKDICQKIFPCLKWAAYIAPEGNPRPGNEPVSYIVTLVNKNIKDNHYEWDVGAAVENMILVGWEYGIASCWLLSVERKEVRHLLKIPETYVIDSVLALGYPAEEPVEEIMRESIKYWKDKEGRLHVPKRKLKDILHFNGF
ncbi:MAG: nitroreductase family protein [Candidatus Aminicenantes bacterium]|nr:nitroreductase family protein [Candidatus Aminicenantes bacterium]